MGLKTGLAVALLVLFAGCSRDAGTEDLGTPTVPATRKPTSTLVLTTPLPRSTLAPLTTRQAAKLFAAAVRPRNSALAKFDADLKASAPVDVLRRDATELVAPERQFLAVLDKTVWPSTILQNVDSLANCISTSILWYDASTRIQQPSEVRLPPSCGGSDAQLIRLRLQLPSY